MLQSENMMAFSPSSPLASPVTVDGTDFGEDGEDGVDAFMPVVGCTEAKEALSEALLVPRLFPHFFPRGVPWKAILLHGPPGTGKTRLARLAARQAGASLVCVSASDLLGSMLGESEKAVRASFRGFTARARQRPTVLFLDEIDALARRRTATEDEAVRRIKCEFLVGMDECKARWSPGSLILAATNTLGDLDPAFLRRFDRKVLVPLPTAEERAQLVAYRLGATSDGVSRLAGEVALATEGLSGSDLAQLTDDALLGPVRQALAATHFKLGHGGRYFASTWEDPEAEERAVETFQPDQIGLRDVAWEDFERAIERRN